MINVQEGCLCLLLQGISEQFTYHQVASQKSSSLCEQKRCEHTTIEKMFMVMVTGIKNFISNCDEQCQLKARIARGGVRHTPHTEHTDYFFISSTKCKIYELNGHLEATIGCGDLPEHQADLRGPKTRDSMSL